MSDGLHKRLLEQARRQSGLRPKHVSGFPAVQTPADASGSGEKQAFVSGESSKQVVGPDVTELLEQITRLQDQLENEQARSTDLSDKLSKAESEAVALQEKNQQILAELETCEGKLSDAKGRVKELKTEIKELKQTSNVRIVTVGEDVFVALQVSLQDDTERVETEVFFKEKAWQSALNQLTKVRDAEHGTLPNSVERLFNELRDFNELTEDESNRTEPPTG